MRKHFSKSYIKLLNIKLTLYTNKIDFVLKIDYDYKRLF